MKHQATSELTGNTLRLAGTNVNEPFDLIADGLLLVPYCYKGLWVSLGVYLQAKVSYERHKEELHRQKKINIFGHSLGAGIGSLIMIMMLKNGFQGNFYLRGQGGVKCLGAKAQDYLYSNVRASVEWQVRHRDPIPHFGWWKAPFHYTAVTGEVRQHIFDYDIAEHVKY